MMYNYSDLERDAIGFILEDESWPVFLAWMRQNVNSEEAREWLNSNPNLETIRTIWMLHSPDEYIRATGSTRLKQEMRE